MAIGNTQFTYPRHRFDCESGSLSEQSDFVELDLLDGVRADSPTLEDYVIVTQDSPSDCSGYKSKLFSICYIF